MTEASIREIFDHYGEVTDVIIKRHVKAEDHQTGYGFVYFATYEQAESVIATVHNTVIDGIKFDCAWSKQPSDHSEGNGASAYPQVKRVKPLTPTNSNKANKRPGFHQFRSDQRGRDMPPPLVLPHASSAGSQQVQYRSRQPTTLQFRQEPSFMPPPRGGGHFRSYMNVDTINDSKSQRQFDRDPYPSQPLSSQQQARPPQPATSTGPPSMSSLPYWQNSHHQPTTNPQPTYAMYSPNLASSTVHMNVSWSNNNHLPPPPAPNSNLVYNQVHEHPNQSMMYYHGSQIAPYYSPPRHHHITYNTQQSSPPSMYPPHDNQNVSYAYNNMPPPPANNHNPSDYNHSQFYHNPSEYR